MGYALILSTCLRSGGPFKLQIAPRLKELKGRVLKPPSIEYGNRSQAMVHEGAWEIQPEGTQALLNPARLSSFGVVIGQGGVDRKAVHGFLQTLLGEAHSLGLSVPQAPCMPAFFVGGGKSIKDDFNEAINQSQQAFGKPAELVFAFFDRISHAYDRFKAFGLIRGVATQALRWDAVRTKTSNKFHVKLNITMKVK